VEAFNTPAGPCSTSRSKNAEDRMRLNGLWSELPYRDSDVMMSLCQTTRPVACPCTRRSKMRSPNASQAARFQRAVSYRRKKASSASSMSAGLTVRTTIQNLVRQGLVEIRRGKGTFVAQPRITQELTELTGFVEDMRVLVGMPRRACWAKRVRSGERVSSAAACAPGRGKRCANPARSSGRWGTAFL